MDITTTILIKENAFSVADLKYYYVDQLVEDGMDPKTITALPLLYNTGSKILAETAKAYLDKLLPKIPATTTKLLIADSPYFKFITGAQKITSNYGAILPGKHPGYEKFECIYIPNYRSLFKQPENQNLIDIGLRLASGATSVFSLKEPEYGISFGSDREILDHLYQYPELVCDIETTGLALNSLVLSVAFAWSNTEGCAISISVNGLWHLRRFFETYRGRLIFHGSLFDIKLLIRNIWMEHPNDYVGMLRGLQCFTNVDDTMLLVYLAKNATTQVPLGLKECALEYVGNYAIDAEDMSKYSTREILEYNLIDAVGTYYLWEKYRDQVDTKPYQRIFRPSIYPLVKMMLVGLPIDPERAKEVDKILGAKEKVVRQQIDNNPHVLAFNNILRDDLAQKANKKLKKLRKTGADFMDEKFNFNSGQQIAKLLHEMLDLPVLEVTKTKQPATGADVLEDLKNHTQDQDLIDLLSHIIEAGDVTKIKNTFIKPFLAAEAGFVHGNLKLGGTQSGRLSSDNPNLTNLPAHGTMGKLVKSCVVAPEGWLLGAADFSALEERIGAILSKDPERIKVYTQGLDGHSMRAHRYFKDQMPDIEAALKKGETATKFWIDDNGEYCCA